MRDVGAGLSDRLLAWYDVNAREMPWRIGPMDRKAGMRADPYRVWLSEVMLQQTTVAAVRAYFLRFTGLWPDVRALAAAPDTRVMEAWAGLGYYARARNLLACARAVVRDHGGVFPGNRAGLLELPGIGPYTASAIAAIAYDEAAVVVDGNVERVMARLHAVEVPLPKAKLALTALAAELTDNKRPGDYAQAVMDLGATICAPRNPSCGICPWREDCAGRALGIQAELPRKSAKKAKPMREGRVWVGRRVDGAMLLETRSERGLLGGMPGWPGEGWDGRAGDAPAAGNWRDVGSVRHTFTHFHLNLQVLIADLPQAVNPERGAFVASGDFRAASLPTLMRKAYDLADAAFGHS